jgi:hypothetical protein
VRTASLNGFAVNREHHPICTKADYKAATRAGEIAQGAGAASGFVSRGENCLTALGLFASRPIANLLTKEFSKTTNY